MKKHFQVVDVFTDEPFGGNPLAVFPDAEGIAEADMQRIAREFNLSETTFVLPPSSPDNDARVRIFTPGIELPMAGHPTVGTSLVLARLGGVARLDPAADRGVLRLELGVGPTSVEIESRDGRPVKATMQQQAPSVGAVLEDRGALAGALSLGEDDLGASPAQVVSCGVEFLVVPLRDRAAAARARVRVDTWEALPEPFAGLSPYLFTLDCESADARAHARLFAPHFGLDEDPATGGAAGPLGGYLVRHGLLAAAEAKAFVVEQGLEMGRPSRIEVGVDVDARAGTGVPEITGVRVGGGCVAMSEGEFEIGPRAR